MPILLTGLSGSWSRSLIERADGSRDTTTVVTWLQAGSSYVDLRQPAAGTTGAQEGFAGTTTLGGDVCTWTRDIDLTPPPDLPDVATLALEGDVLVERGVHEAYTEHWHRDSQPGPELALTLRDVETGGRALLVRNGPRFGWARAADPAEVSLGIGWTVQRSSDPARVGQALQVDPDGDRATVDGRRYDVLGVEGDPALLVPAFTEIPVVDVSRLLHGDEAGQRAVAAELGRAAREVGFLYVTGTDVDPAVYDALLAATKQFFELPAEQKMAVYIGLSRNHRGYVPPGEEVLGGQTRDLKEAFDLSLDLPADDPDHLAGNPLLGPNAWPDLPGFAAAVTPYYDAVMELGRALLRGFAMALGEAPSFFDGHVRKPPSQLRLLHYPFDAEATDTVGLGAHSDYECFTLLRSTSPGLEVLNGDGVWVDAPPRPDAFVLNIGDLLETWTNGLFVATSHRVRKVSQERWSFPLFFNVDYDTVVAPLPQFVREGQAPRPPLVAGEHLFAQTAQTFAYLKRRLASGELVLADGALPLSSFGQTARQGGDRAVV